MLNRTGNNLRHMLTIAAFILIAAITTPALAGFQSAWRPLNASCSRGARVSVSASGNVTATFWYWTGFWTSSYSTTVNFGPGMSKDIATGFGASYTGVALSGNLTYASNAACR